MRHFNHSTKNDLRKSVSSMRWCVSISDGEEMRMFANCSASFHICRIRIVPLFVDDVDFFCAAISSTTFDGAIG